MNANVLRDKLACAVLEREIGTQQAYLQQLLVDPQFVDISGDLKHPLHECLLRGRNALNDALAAHQSLLRDIKRAHRSRARRLKAVRNSLINRIAAEGAQA